MRLVFKKRRAAESAKTGDDAKGESIIFKLVDMVLLVLLLLLLVFSFVGDGLRGCCDGKFNSILYSWL